MENLLKPLFFKGHTLHRFWRKVFFQKKYRYVKKWGGHTQLRKGLVWLHNLVFKLDCPK